MYYLLGMTIVQRIRNSFHYLDNLILILTLVMILGLTELPTLHILHHNIKVVIIIIDFINLNNIRVLKPKQYLALIQEHPYVLLTDPLLVDDLYRVLVEVLAEDGFLHFGKGTLTEQLLEDVVVLDRLGGDEVRDH